jgi:hypothetical protein
MAENMLLLINSVKLFDTVSTYLFFLSLSYIIINFKKASLRQFCFRCQNTLGGLCKRYRLEKKED